MAYYAALVSVVELLREITSPDSKYILDKQHIHVSLYEKFNFLLELLEDYSPRDHKAESNDILERRIRDAAYRAQDIIETQRFEEPPTPDDIVEKEYYQDLEKVKAEVDSIVEEDMTIKEISRLHLKSSSICEDSAGGAKAQVPSGRNTKVVFDEDLFTTIKEQLCGEPCRREVISFVGMGGVGKSTLARSIFEDKLIDEHFDCRAWVTVSQDYRLHNILQAIVDSLKIKTGELGKGEEGVLVEYIYKYLKCRRYLIVMDDMWETKVWDGVKRTFPDDYNGSRVITTTRLSDVAFYAGSHRFIHRLQLLDEDQSWNLFSQKVLCPLELEDIGRVIAKKCRGLPLVSWLQDSYLRSIRHDMIGKRLQEMSPQQLQMMKTSQR